MKDDDYTPLTRIGYHSRHMMEQKDQGIGGHTGKPSPRTARVLLALLAVVAVSLVPLWTRVGVRDVGRVMENVSMLSSQETWLRQHGMADAPADGSATWLIPHYNGRPRITKPPMLVWVNMLAWWDLDPATSTPQQVLARSRYLTAIMGALFCAAIFWIGCTLTDVRQGALAALVAASCWFFERQARTVAYDMHLVLWTTLAVAGAIWAMQPFKPAAPRWQQIIGWAFCGFMLGMGWMTKGPLALVLVIVPILTIGGLMLRDRDKRWWQSALGLTAAAVIAAAITLPWYQFVAQTYPQSLETWSREIQAERKEFQTPFYYFAFVGLIFPWSMWLIIGIIHPLLAPLHHEHIRKETRHRYHRWVPLLWFLSIFILLSIPAAKQQRYALPLVAPAALLVAQVFMDHDINRRATHRDKGATVLAHLHGFGLVVSSLFMMVLLGWTDALGRLLHMDMGRMESIPKYAIFIYGPLLVTLAIVGWRWHARGYAWKAGINTAVWGIVAFTVLWAAYDTGRSAYDQVRQDATALAPQVSSGDVFYLDSESHPLQTFHDHEEFLFYFRRVVKPAYRTEIEQWPSEGGQYLLVSSSFDVKTLGWLTTCGFQPTQQVTVDKDGTFTLWTRNQAMADSRKDYLLPQDQ